MATSNILGLFTSPEEYQAQQMGAEQQRALGFAQLSPMQLANYSLFLGGQQLGRGFGGLLGVQDPQLQRIRQRQEIMQSINPADPQSLIAGIQRASELNDPELALSLTDYMNKQASEVALAKQRGAEKQSGELQAAARIAEIEKLLPTLDPNSTDYKSLVAEKTRLEVQRKAASGDKVAQLTDLYRQRKDAVALFGENSQDVKILDRLINSIAPEKGGDKSFERLAISERIGVLTDEIAELERTNQKDTQQYRRKTAELKSLEGDKTGGKEIKEIVIADQIVALDKVIRNAKDSAAPEVLDAKAKLDVLRSQLKSDKPNLTVVGEVKTGPDKGKAVILDETKDQQFVYDFDKAGKQIRKPFVGDVDRVTSQVTATASSSGALTEKTITKGLAELDIEDIKTARANKKAASASNDSLRKLLELSDQGLISGSFASGRVGATNLLNTLGILSTTSAKNLARSEEYQKIGADLVFNALQGKLGPGVSEGDRKFITELFPKLENSAAARRELIEYLADKNNKIIAEADAVEAYLRKDPKRGLEGYKPKNTGVFYVPSNKIDLTNMSPQDLKALEQKLLKEKKGGNR